MLGEVDRGFAPGDAYRDEGEAVIRSVAVRFIATGEKARRAVIAAEVAARTERRPTSSKATEGPRVPVLLPASMSVVGACTALSGAALAGEGALGGTLLAFGLQ